MYQDLSHLTWHMLQFQICNVGEYSVMKVDHPDKKKCSHQTLSNETANAIDDTLNNSSSEDDNEPDSDRHCLT